MTIRSTTLDCGLRVVTERMPDVRSVTLGFWVGTGSRDEADHLAGASHFLEHLLFKGTPTRSAREIAESIDAVGGDMNAFTTKEYTAFYVRVLAGSLGLGVEVLSDLMWSPAFRPDDVECERQVILEEILMRGDEPSEEVHEVLAEALWPGHPLGREVLGTEEAIETMTVADIAGFFGEHYHPANMVLSAAGYLDHDDLCAQIEQHVAGAAANDRGAPGPRSLFAERVPPAPDAAAPVTVVHRSTEQAHVVVGLPALDRHDPDRWALSVLDHALGGGMASRLFQTIREDRGLAYSVYSYRCAFDDAGALAVYAGTMPAKAHEVLALIHDELDAVREKGITERELTVAKGHLLGELALSLEDSAARMSRIGRSLLAHGEVLALDDITSLIEGVTLHDVARVGAEVLAAPRTLAVVGPFTGKDFATGR